jgi:hypothetical protein
MLLTHSGVTLLIYILIHTCEGIASFFVLTLRREDLLMETPSSFLPFFLSLRLCVLA